MLNGYPPEYASTSNGDIFVFYMLLENKKSRFRLEIRISLSFILFKVVPPEIAIKIQVAEYHWLLKATQL